MKKHLFLILFAIVASVSTTSAAITVRLDPQSCSSWSTVRLWAWTSAGNVFNAWPGEIVSKDGDGWYAYTFDESITEVNIIWNDNGESQTGDITGITESTCFAFYINGPCHIVDCPGDAKHVRINDFFYNLHGTDRIAELTYQNRQRDKNYPWTSSADIPASVTYNGINYRVTSIGDSAFCFCTSLTSIDIPNSITSIGEHAFYGCTGLTSMTIPNSVTSIGRRAFNDCSGLTSITVSPNNPIYDSRNNCNAIIETSTNTLIAGCQNTIIPNSVTSIGDYAFCDCSSLTSITIPNSVTSIGDYAFCECRSLTSVTIGNSVTSIGNWAFGYCSSLTSITIGSGVTSIGRRAFSNCSSLTSVTIPNSVTSIGEGAFYGCSSLTSVNIPDGVTSIGEKAFYKCSSLTSVTIPNSVTSIGEYAFFECSSLTSVTIGNSVTSIGRSAFNDCSGLTSVTIGNSVTSIGNAAFYGCSSLTSITIPNSVTSIGEQAFIRCNITSINFGGTLADWCNKSWSTSQISYDYTLSINGVLQTDITIPNSVTSIGDWAFENCSSLTSVTIPNSVTSIGEGAFSRCSSLTSITIGSGVTRIGSFAFENCSSLTSVTCMATTPPSITSNVFLFVDCSTIPLYVPAQSVGLYKEADHWKNFRVLPIDFSGYTITFANWDGSILQLLYIEEGEIPEYTGVTPTRSDDDEFTYTFIGWSPTIVAATEDATYTATYEASPLQYYTIRFENWDNSELQSIQVAENKMPVYTGPTPTRPNDDEYTYTFIGWSPTIVAATEDATYTAKYEAKERAITVRLNPQSCSSWSTVRLWAWTDNGNIFDAWPGEIISKDGDGWYSYTFEKSITSVSVIWNNGTDQTVDINNVTESTCYSLNSQSGKSITVSAVSCPKKKYTITFVNWNGDELQKGQVLEGEMPQYAGLTPTRPDDENYTYEFSGWTPEIVAATEDATYTAVYNTNSKPNYYTIQFINWNGDELQKGQVLEGEMPQYAGLAPTRPDDENYTYEFSGWTPEIVPANEDATYTATYEESQKAQVGFESVVEENVAIRMIINNGHLLILLPDGKTYTVQGQEVR